MPRFTVDETSKMVRISNELIEILSRDWSGNVQVKIESETGNSEMVLVFRNAREPIFHQFGCKCDGYA